MTITSNTIVKNGMPFIGRVLRAVAPFMDEMIVTISAKSDDGTIAEIQQVKLEVGDNMTIFWEDVARPGELTEIRNQQARRSSSEWILFLDDDDLWPEDQLELCLEELRDANEDIKALSVKPYQLLDQTHYDASWEKKSFSKFLRRKGLHYLRDWPADMPADESGSFLYWKTHPQVKKVDHFYYHLANLKGHTFREEGWAKRYRPKTGTPIHLKRPLQL